MRTARQASPPAACGLLLLVLSVPLLADSGGATGPGGSVARLQNELTLVSRFAADYPKSAFSKAIGLVVEDIEKARGAHSGNEQLVRLSHRALMTWASALHRGHEDDQALVEYGKVIHDGPSPSYAEAADAAGRIYEARAGNEKDQDKALSEYSKAEQLFGFAKDDSARERVHGRVIALRSAKGLAAYKEKDYGKAFELLDAVRQDMNGLGKGSAAEAYDFLVHHTGVLNIDPVAPSIPTSDRVGSWSSLIGSSMELEPDGGSGDAEKCKTARSLRWVTGTYRLSITAASGSEPAIVMPVKITTVATTLKLPAKIPPGMVYVPAGAGVGAFFIDRTEVTVKAFRKFDPGYHPQYDQDGLPAQNISFKDAGAFAKSQGKELPTKEEWMRAAFGSHSEWRFPWGDAPPSSGDFANLGSGKPEPVGTHPKGASWVGAQDMAGNVWEWLRQGYAVGGGFRAGFSAYQNLSPARNPVKDPKPGPAAWNAARGPVQRSYRVYRVTQGNLIEVGFRCVIEL